VPAEFYIEFLDVDRFPGETQQMRTRDYMRDKYRERLPDVIIAGGGSALHFLVKHRATLFPRVPVVHCGVEPNEIPKSMPDDLIVGIPHAVNVAETLELALRLQPSTLHVAIVDGINNGGLTPANVSSLASKVGFLWLTNRSIPELREELSRLPDHTVAFYGTMFRDHAGNAFTPRAALTRFAPASRVPIYGYYDTYLGHGIVGGSMVTFQTVGRTAAQIAIRILNGQPPQEAIRGATHAPTPMFDWHQLHRWNISESRLPPGSVVLFRPPTLWEDHKRAIISGVALFLIEAGLIVGLTVQSRRRRRAEAVARESEQAARELSGRLIHTQEEERSRIARDLHDDFNQRLALLSVEIDLLGRKASTPDDTAKLQQLGERARELSSDVHRLAYQVHPAKLDQLGLVAAYDWEHEQWTVPINLMAAQLVKIGKMPVQFQIGGKYYAEGPRSAPDWGIRLNVTFLFPK
jgi:signal transduction histidine kinase